MSVTEFLSWTKSFIKMPGRDRIKIKELILSQIKNKNKKLYNLVTSNDMEFIGVVSSTKYFKCSGPADELDAVWVHPHGGPALLYGHKKGGWLIIVSPLLRVNDSLINEVPENSKKVAMRGISG